MSMDDWRHWQEPDKPDWLINWLALNNVRCSWSPKCQRWELKGVNAKWHQSKIYVSLGTTVERFVDKAGYLTGDK